MTVRAEHKLQAYYRWHARVYDATRWTFLFGRREMARMVAKAAGAEAPRIVEVGCGTGRNLQQLVRAMPQARISGVDLCAPMLAKAASKLRRCPQEIGLVHAAYDVHAFSESSCDVLLFSYALSMFNPGYTQALDAAQLHLAPGGFVAVVDFHGTRFQAFKAWMEVNHVRMDRHLLPELDVRFRRERLDLRGAYGGVWEYFLYLGRKV